MLQEEGPKRGDGLEPVPGRAVKYVTAIVEVLQGVAA